MALPARSLLRRPPPPSPSLTLIGMEKVVPPGFPSAQQSAQYPEPDIEKPLPERPQPSRRSSSIYSRDSGYTKIIDLYVNWNVDDEPATPIALRPIDYRETLTGLLARRFTQSPSPISPLTIPYPPKHAVSIPSLQLTSEDSPVTSAVEQRAAPSFTEFSRGLQVKRSNMVSPLSSLASPHYAAVSRDTFWQPSLRSSPELRAVPCVYERKQLPGEVSPRITDIDNTDLVPLPLDLARSNRSSNYQKLGMLKADHGSEILLSEEGSGSKFSSTSSSDSSFVVYTGVRESIRAIIRSKVGKKKESIRKGKETAKAVVPTEDQVPTSDPHRQPERKFSWVSSRKSSLQGVTSILRSLSLTKPPSPNRHTPSSPRVRQKQLAIPLTPYQKYGTAVWHNSQRKKRRHARATRAAQKSAPPAGGIRRLPTQNRRRDPHRQPSEVFTAFQSGRIHLLDALDETKQRIARTNSEKRRQGLEKNVTLQNIGEKQEARYRIFRSSSGRRRERLKKSITLIGPVDPYTMEPIAITNSGERENVLKGSIELVQPAEAESTRQAENWL